MTRAIVVVCAILSLISIVSALSLWPQVCRFRFVQSFFIYECPNHRRNPSPPQKKTQPTNLNTGSTQVSLRADSFSFSITGETSEVLQNAVKRSVGHIFWNGVAGRSFFSSLFWS
jgi:hypothetical protein